MPSHGVLWLSLLLALTAALSPPASAKVMTEAEARKKLIELNAGNLRECYICLMRHVSKFNTSLITPNAAGASSGYGVFQITSDKWCCAYRKGGVCNANCNDFLNDNIADDFECARKVVDQAGFKNWSKWMRYCYKNPNPCPCGCRKKQALRDDDDAVDVDEEEEVLAVPARWRFVRAVAAATHIACDESIKCNIADAKCPKLL